MDNALAQKLATYANQYALEGNKEMAKEYKMQATILGTQAKTFADIASGYHKRATKIQGTIPILQGMAGTAGDFAAFKVDPDATLPAEHVFPFTPVPPLEFVQTGQAVSTHLR